LAEAGTSGAIKTSDELGGKSKSFEVKATPLSKQIGGNLSGKKRFKEVFSLVMNGLAQA
jgi:hypothetical protein